MLITSSNTWEPGFRKRTINRRFQLGPISIKFVTIALLAVAALFYIAQSAQGTASKYKISQLEDQKSQIQTDVRQLEVESARLKSLNEIKNNVQVLNLEPVN